MIKLICAVIMLICTLVIALSSIRTYKIYKELDEEVRRIENEHSTKDGTV